MRKKPNLLLLYGRVFQVQDIFASLLVKRKCISVIIILLLSCYHIYPY